ncbi:MAG: hypothetical protein IIU08_02985, partial [Clostridia bacterium]|nr:hypothetical protein [Clostridia bacterium]
NRGRRKADFLRDMGSLLSGCMGNIAVLFSFIEEPVQQVEREYQKRNSQEVMGVPKSADFGSGRCPDTRGAAHPRPPF